MKSYNYFSNYNINLLKCTVNDLLIPINVQYACTG